MRVSHVKHGVIRSNKVIAVFRALLRASSRIRPLVAEYRRVSPDNVSVSRVFYTRSWTLFDIIIDLPASKRPVRYTVYVSAQKWYMAPSKALPKLRKLREYVRKHPNPYPVDHMIVLLCERATEGTIELAKKFGVVVANEEQLLNELKNYFRSRYNGLLNKLRGKRIHGELALLVAFLQEALKEYGVDFKPLFPDMDTVRLALYEWLDVEKLLKGEVAYAAE